MIPIIYESTELAFNTNGLGRLRDCISCKVTEERNGIYECDFEYPINGAHFNLIQCGRIIGVTHEDTEDIQPFDIVSFSRPINGVITFHCVHISYRQSFLVARATGAINSLSAAFSMLEAAQPSNPFYYLTDKTSTGFLAMSDGIPRSVKQLLGGGEGSILDTYGGEFEWDRWNVYLHSARGKAKDFPIRYKVNMLDYNEDYDSSGSYSSCIPYWTDGTNKVIGSIVNSAGQTLTGRGECVPLDVSDKFQSQPTKAQVEAMAASIMNESNPFIPSQSIRVEFLRLHEVGYIQFSDIFRCNLCDVIPVVFPYYNMTGSYKIVKTVWDVLNDRYESMDLGSLQISLSQALGINKAQ